jgi:hypothetical protein
MTVHSEGDQAMTDTERYLEIVPSIVPWPVGAWGRFDICGSAIAPPEFVLRLGRGPVYIPNYVALCILRDAVREWLEAWALKRGAVIQYTYDGCEQYVYVENPDSHDKDVLLRTGAPTIDDTLIAAVKAASEEE